MLCGVQMRSRLKHTTTNDKSVIDMARNLSIDDKSKPESLLVKPPPHTITSVGKEEDSIQNCLHLQPKAPKRNLKKLLDYAGKVK